jgi:predicted  nucleic acid-binding Zn-ribbon protein
MTELDILLKIVTAVLAGWFGLLEYRMRKINDKVDDMYTKEETKELIDLKQESIKNNIDNIKESQDEIKSNIQDIKKDIQIIVNKSSK